MVSNYTSNMCHPINGKWVLVTQIHKDNKINYYTNGIF